MDGNPVYINVIIPLKLAWEPYYVLDEGESVQLGDRVGVPLAGRRYIGVVSGVDVPLPESVKPSSVKGIYSVHDELPRILPSEIAFWRSIADYYMCGVGEVYKAAYPSVMDETPSRRSKAAARQDTSAPEAGMSLPDPDSTDNAFHDAESIEKAFAKGKPVFFQCADPEDVMVRLCLDRRDTQVLWLVPEVKFEKALQDHLKAIFGSRLVLWGNNLTPARRRDAARRVRSGEPCVVVGTRSALFLPFSRLGLVMVRDEHEPSYKQVSPAPRYNGRDAAVLLAMQSGAAMLLQSGTPSLETLYNARTGRYTAVSAETMSCGGAVDASDFAARAGVAECASRAGVSESGSPAWVSECAARAGVEWEMVDTRAELRKNGMVGEISRKMMEARPDAFYKPRRAIFPKMEELVPQLKVAFGDGAFVTDDLVETPLPERVAVLGIFGVDALLGRADFRADERAMQVILQAVSACGASLRKVVIQTREASHPVFRALCSCDCTPLLEERRKFGYPPFTRIVDILVKDSSPQRLSYMCSELLKSVTAPGFGVVMPRDGGVRVILPRNKFLSSRKATLISIVESFEKERKYASHIAFDVDPQN